MSSVSASRPCSSTWPGVHVHHSWSGCQILAFSGGLTAIATARSTTLNFFTLSTSRPWRPARLRLAARLALRVHAPGCPPGRGNLLTYKSVYMYTLCNARGSRCPAGGRYSRLLLPYEGSTPAASGPCASLHKRSRPRRSLVTCQLQRGALLWRSQVGSHFDSTFHSHPTS